MSSANHMTTACLSILGIAVLLTNAQGMANTVLVAAGNAAAFQTALNNANPGDTIRLAGGTNLGSFYNCSMTDVPQGMYRSGSVQPIPADPVTFKEMTWIGEGGDAYVPLVTNVIAFPRESGTPRSCSLGQNYPNPFNPATTISYSIPSTSFVSLTIFDVLGREVADLVSEVKETGSHVVPWDAGELPSGMYLYQLRVGGSTETKTCMLLK